MDCVLIVCLLFAFLSTGFCTNVQGNKSEHATTQVRKSRENSLRGLLACSLRRDVSCFLDTADVIVEERMQDILAQADRKILKSSGRADDENSPSQLSQTINKIISELTDMFKESLSGFFKSAKDGEDEVAEEEEEEEGASDEEEAKKEGRSTGETRKKKKKGKLVALIKLVIIGLVLKAKITLLLKALSAALQVKFFLVAVAGLILNAARFWLDLKKGHQPQKVIYYEHAQHQHHYEGEDDWGGGGGGGYWGRAYDEEDTSASAQNLAYAKQKPYKVDNDKSSFSWFG